LIWHNIVNVVLSEENLKKLETDSSSYVMRVHSSGIEKR